MMTKDDRKLVAGSPFMSPPPGCRYLTHEDISDYSRCPRCVAGEPPAAAAIWQTAATEGFANHYYNQAGALWAVCIRHCCRWYVTRELLSSFIPEVPAGPSGWEEVDGVHHHHHRPRTSPPVIPSQWVLPTGGLS
jgi:hypothetical protein